MMTIFEKIFLFEESIFHHRSTLGLEKPTKMKDRIISWNIDFPADFLFRKKSKIIFGSPQHRAMTMEDIIFSLKEEDLFLQISNEFKSGKTKQLLYKTSDSNPNIVDQKEDVDKDFDELNFEDFNNGENYINDASE